MLSYKNAALDQFVSGCLEFTGNVVRVGGKCGQALQDISVSAWVERRKREGVLRGGGLRQVIEDLTTIRGQLEGAFADISVGQLTGKILAELCPAGFVAALLEGAYESDLDVVLQTEYLKRNAVQAQPKTGVISTPGAPSHFNDVFDALSGHPLALEAKQATAYGVNGSMTAACGAGAVLDEDSELTQRQDVMGFGQDLQQQLVRNLHAMPNFLAMDLDTVTCGDIHAATPQPVLSVLQHVSCSGASEDQAASQAALCKARLSSLVSKCAGKPWNLLHEERSAVETCCLYLYRAPRIGRFAMLFNRHLQLVDDLKRLSVQRQASALSGLDVVAMTTTGAAIHIDLIRALRPSAVIVEEAAEILEGNLIAALPSTAEQLIMIGDPFQLRPIVNDYNLANSKFLSLSAMERLHNIRLSMKTLATQRRMHPDISVFTSWIYASKIIDHPSVLSRTLPCSVPGGRLSTLPGFSKRVVFFLHSFREEYKGVSVYSKREGDFVYDYGKFLTQHCGVPASSVTVITPYLGQCHHLRETVRYKCGSKPASVSCSKLVEVTLPCGHIDRQPCWVTMQPPGSSDNSGDPVAPDCSRCRSMVQANQAEAAAVLATLRQNEGPNCASGRAGHGINSGIHSQSRAIIVAATSTSELDSICHCVCQDLALDGRLLPVPSAEWLNARYDVSSVTAPVKLRAGHLRAQTRSAHPAPLINILAPFNRAEQIDQFANRGFPSGRLSFSARSALALIAVFGLVVGVFNNFCSDHGSVFDDGRPRPFFVAMQIAFLDDEDTLSGANVTGEYAFKWNRRMLSRVELQTSDQTLVTHVFRRKLTLVPNPPMLPPEFSMGMASTFRLDHPARGRGGATGSSRTGPYPSIKPAAESSFSGFSLDLDDLSMLFVLTNGPNSSLGGGGLGGGSFGKFSKKKP
eukprot:gene9208-234_t